MTQHPSTLSLTVRKGPKKGKTYPLMGDSITIGRLADNHIVIDYPMISRHHARLTWQEGSCLLEDLGSSNGTWVNNVRITRPVVLRPGDTIGLGKDVLLDFSARTESDETMYDASGQHVSTPGVVPPPSAPPALPLDSAKRGWFACGLGGLMGLAVLALLVAIGVAVYLLVVKPATISTVADGSMETVPTLEPSPLAPSPEPSPTLEEPPTPTLTPQPTATPTPLLTETPTLLPTATRPSIPPVEPNPAHDVLLYSDDFDDPDSGWGATANDNRERYYENGEYVFLIKSDDWATWTWGSEEDFSDFTLEADARLVDGPGIGRLGVIFRHQDNNNYYYVYISAEGEYRVGKKQDGEWGSVSDVKWTPSPHIKTGRATNHLKLVCFGSMCSIYANGEHLITVEDDDFDAGKVGLIAETVPGADSIKAAFDNFEVYGAGTETAAEPGPPPESKPVAQAIPPPGTGAAVWGEVILPAKDRPSVFGPKAGSLPHKVDGSVEANAAGVDLRDAVIEAVYHNPYPTSKGDWDIGFLFRDAGANDEFRLNVSSAGLWSLNNRRGEEDVFVDQGRVSNLDVSAGGLNRVTLLVEGAQGFLFVNDEYIAELDLTGRMNSGNISVASGIATDDEIDGETTTYEGFTIWSLVPQAQQPARATETTVDPPPSNPTPAPSLNRIAFVSDRDGNKEIYVMPAPGTQTQASADGSGVIRLTNNPAEDTSPAWSPDGTRIAFVSTRDGNPEIYGLDTDGGSGVMRLTNNPAPDYDPTWSPDGKYIAFISARDDPVKSDIWVMPAPATQAQADGSKPVKLHDFGVSPAWSPDGGQIAAIFRFGTGMYLGVMPADGSAEPRPLLRVDLNNFPAWSPDGRRIAFENVEGPGDSEILVINADGSNLVSLTNNQGIVDSHPTWSADGKHMAFVSDRAGNSEIYMVPAPASQAQVNASGDAVRLTNNPAWDAFPAWSP